MTDVKFAYQQGFKRQQPITETLCADKIHSKTKKHLTSEINLILIQSGLNNGHIRHDSQFHLWGERERGEKNSTDCSQVDTENKISN